MSADELIREDPPLVRRPHGGRKTELARRLRVWLDSVRSAEPGWYKFPDRVNPQVARRIGAGTGYGAAVGEFASAGRNVKRDDGPMRCDLYVRRLDGGDQ